MSTSTVFDVGMHLTLEKEFDKNNMKHKTQLLGWKEDGYIMVELPKVNGIYTDWKSGTSCLLKFINKGSIFQFKSTLIKTLLSPAPIMFLRFPKKIENATTRKQDRIQTYLICDTFSLDENLKKKKFDLIDDENFEKNAVLLDFSADGGLVELKNNLISFAIGEKIGMTFTMPSNVIVDTVVCELRNIRIESGRKLLGLRFLNDSPEPIKQIKQFFEKYNEDFGDF